MKSRKVFTQMFASTRPKLYNTVTVGKLEHIRMKGFFSPNKLGPLSKMLRSRGAATSRVFIFIEYLQNPTI